MRTTLTASQQKYLEEVLALSGDDEKEVEKAVRTVIGRHFRGPEHNGSRSFHFRLLMRKARGKILAARRKAELEKHASVAPA